MKFRFQILISSLNSISIFVSLSGVDIRYYILDYNFNLGIRFQFLFSQRRTITNLVYIITSIFYNNNMHNVAYYVHINILMRNMLHVIRFYFSLHNINIYILPYDFMQILHIFPTTFMQNKHIFLPTFMQNKAQNTVCLSY